MTELDICLYQMNTQIGNLTKNTQKISTKIEELHRSSENCDILVTPEMSLIGYPPMDLLRRDTLYEVQDEKIETLKQKTVGKDFAVIVGFCRRTSTGLFNSLLVLHNGTVLQEYDKQLLPTYDVFDGHRYFETGNTPKHFTINNTKVGLSICEDAWYTVDVMDMKKHSTNPFEDFDTDTETIINLSASPFRVEKPNERIELFHQHAVDTNTEVVFCNQVGANDELIFDGNSFIINPDGQINRLSDFEETSKVIHSLPHNKENTYKSDQTAMLIDAITTGIKDYFDKTGFSKAIVGMSGGIDSSVATALTVQALGKENVLGVTMPSEITTNENISDAEAVATNLGITFEEIPIQNSVSSVTEELQQNSEYKLSSLAQENIQARIRGDMLMSLANTTDSLVITPDNKSEAAIGYCTLYGDTVGAIAPLGDCYKRYVYDIGKRLDVIPQQIIDKQPTAELKEDQQDTDDMPPYEVLDQVLQDYVENRSKPEETQLDSKQQIMDIISRIHQSEFKRNQSPIPLRVTQKDFGRGWRYPLSGDYSFLDT